MASSNRGIQHLLSASKDMTLLLNRLRAIHAPDERDIDLKPLLHIFEVIFQRAAPTVPGSTKKAHMDAQNDKAFQAEHGELIEQHAFTIRKISNEIVCRCSRSGDAHTTTLSILTMVSEYTWEAKVALTLTAFTAYYGDFWLIAQLYAADPSAKPVAILNQLPESMEHPFSYKPKFEAIDNLLRAIVNVSKLVAEFKETLRGLHSTKDTPAYKSANAVIPRAAYWIIRSMVACASQFAGLISISNEYIPSTTEAWELDNLQMDLYKLLINHTFDTPQVDNMKILQLLTYSKEYQLLLWDCSAKQRKSIDVLRRRLVLLLISDLDLSLEELSILEQMYQESRQHPARMESQYEILWLPVIDSSAPWNDEKKRQFEALQSMMPWYTVHHLSLIDPVVLNYIKEVWHFDKKPMLVVLDPQGRITNPNALHMMWIWGSMAFPFTRAREEALWREEYWRLDLLADAIEPMMFQWIQEEKFICLYGGEDLDWIQKFTAKLHDTARAAPIELEMLYVGRSNPKEKIRKNNDVIATQGLGHVLPDLTLVWYFWERLKSMRDSKIQLGKTVQDDPILREVETMMSFDGCSPGWALISKGPSDMVKANGDTFVMCLDKFDQWKEDVPVKGFVQAIIDHL
ncbi:protein SIEVE ELEMENT OCCLUSION B-like [Chenopodium quinoa]|uniref:protein SIEVE ELEMENT OCCLUSION B-like n=1 Tax=Chenopodium quinoa TaxID=63459 RepID=UPI000B7710A4|nr:protein SIEVE ELEMENT OCCLUSION B-like [Chenopodium quinoa]